MGLGFAAPRRLPPGRIGGGLTAARLAWLLLAWLLLLLVAAPPALGATTSDRDDSTRELLGGRKSRPLLDNCTAERVIFKAWARKTVLPVTKSAKVRVKINPTRRPLTNATLVLSVLPEGAALYRKTVMHPPALRSAKRHARGPVVLDPGHVMWPGLAVGTARAQGFKVKLDLTECAADKTVAVSVALFYQGSMNTTCAIVSYPVKVSLGGGRADA